MRFVIFLALISTQAFATDWYDLVEKNTYKLAQSFQLTQLERSGSKLEITKGEEVELKEAISLSPVNVVLYVFNYKNCPGPAMKTDMEIIPVQGTSPVVEIGAQLEEQCELNVYIETKDLMSKSIFE